MTNNSDQIMLVPGKIVKDQWLLRSLNLLLLMLQLVRHGDEELLQLRASCSTLSKFWRHFLQFLLIPSAGVRSSRRSDW